MTPMATVLHISASGSVVWEKSAQGWAQTSVPPVGPVWVVTDLSEEAFVEITVPRIFGADRSNFVQRQLASRFPESAFRIALPPRGKGGVMARLAPPLQTLTAIEPADRILAALKTLQAPVAGVWSTSMLLVHLGQKSSLPADLFVVLCQPTSMRILFLKQRSPVLTRLIATTASAAEQAAEVVRTLRHLENTHVLERGSRRFGVLLLGGADGLASALSADRLDVLPLPDVLGSRHTSDWNHVLFDVVCKGPPGQLAPLSYRAAHLARGVAKAARIGLALSVAVALWVASGRVSSSLQAQRERTQVQAAIEDISAHIAKVDLSIEAFGVSPDLVRKALALDADEITSAPDIASHMAQLATVVGSVPGAHLKNMQWQVLNPADVACLQEGAASAAAVTPDSVAEPQPPSRKVELQMTLLLADGIGPRQTAQQAGEITRLLKKMEGVTVVRDPARGLREGDISTGLGKISADRDLVWCATLPGAPAAKQIAKGGAL